MRALLVLLLLAAPAWYLFARAPQARAAELTTEVAAAPAQAQAADPLDALFAAADASTAGLAPLITAASARIATSDGAAGHALAERLEPYCKRAYFSPERDPALEALGVVVHTVKKGEVPSQLVRPYRIGDGLLARLNDGYAPTRLQVGQKLKLPSMAHGDLRLVVDRERHRLGAWRGGGQDGWLLVAYLPVGLGAPETPTPSGTTRVVERVRDPEWRDPNSGVVYPPGDPGNSLGGYWMRLDEAGIGQQGIGLHGFTRDDPSVWLGKDASNGCVRMLKDDMDRIFYLALEGTPVQFVP